MAEKKKEVVKEVLPKNLCASCKNYFSSDAFTEMCLIAKSKPGKEVLRCSHYEK